MTAKQVCGKLLLKLGLITDRQLEGIVGDYQGGPIARLAREGVFAESAAISAVAKELRIPEYAIPKHELFKYAELLSREELKPVQATTWRELNAVPVAVGKSRVVVAFANPLDYEAKSTLEFALGMRVEAAITSESIIMAVIATELGTSDGFSLATLLEASAALQPERAVQESRPALEADAFSADVAAPPIVKLVDKIFNDAISVGASDLHVSPGAEGLTVRARVDGLMRELFVVPVALQNSVISRLKLLGGMDISERRKAQDGRLRIKTGFGVKDIRLSSLPTIHGENLVARILSSDLSGITYDNLGIPEEVQLSLRRDIDRGARMILICGPTGSGKTSTLYATLLTLRDGSTNIISIEDPIEYRIPGINQIPVQQKNGVTFAEGLRSALRQDPDVVMVGEIRDAETGAIAMQSAQTGHIVLSTIHTNSAAASVTRLKDLGIEPYLCGASLGGILAQRLIRRVCKKCCTLASSEVKAEISNLGFEPQKAVSAGAGCPECSGTGYHGRVGIYSYLSVNEECRELIRSGASESKLEAAARRDGFRTLAEAGLNLVLEGITTLDELQRTVGEMPASPNVQKAAPKNGVSKRKVLLVEDDENTRMVLALLLEKEFFDVIEAANGREALNILFDNLPDIILSDVMMPDIDGVQLVQRLKNDPRTREIPVIMLTANDSEENELKLLSSGADDFVSKTTNPAILIARVQRLGLVANSSP
jgi:type IV pilus assembly protein PilB